MSGWRCRNKAKRGISHLVRKVGTLASVSTPASSTSALASNVADSILRRQGEIRTQKARPAGVNWIPRPCFLSSGLPMKFSSPTSCLLTALTEMQSTLAASVKLPCCATASKASSSEIVGQFLFMANYKVDQAQKYLHHLRQGNGKPCRMDGSAYQP